MTRGAAWSALVAGVAAGACALGGQPIGALAALAAGVALVAGAGRHLRWPR